jgi:hypothetical protein
MFSLGLYDLKNKQIEIGHFDLHFEHLNERPTFFELCVHNCLSLCEKRLQLYVYIQYYSILCFKFKDLCDVHIIAQFLNSVIPLPPDKGTIGFYIFSVEENKLCDDLQIWNFPEFQVTN